MNDRGNTIAGWVLAGGIAALGLSIVTGEYFHAERPETMGYTVEGVEAEAGGEEAAAEQPIEVYLAKADPAKGEQVFKKCAACHNADNGGPNALGPNLWGVLGESIGTGANGFAFSDALKGKGGTWNWDNLAQWLKNPKAFAPGTKMTFAGLSKPEDRADVIAFLNQHSASPLPMPAAPAATATAAAPEGAASPEKAAAEGKDDAQKAGNVPVPTEAQAAKQPAGNIAGPAAPATSGQQAQQRPTK
ncbi:cytochrome c family protein [Sphingomonas naphthae]|uniref:Cytochrome c family protein n=1 Tax=Sphingomonas naphthae TaxID=1813468 RepID=A0ABY7TQV1_9SPHN|nr:cytochrome c family protein [Sphingomonas naphthae]WCT74564.1 cytochrome c family protein [Sphingomonas naphthae]